MGNQAGTELDFKKLEDPEDPSNIVLICDNVDDPMLKSPGFNELPASRSRIAANRHSNGGNLLFVDTHVGWMEEPDTMPDDMIAWE